MGCWLRTPLSVLLEYWGATPRESWESMGTALLRAPTPDKLVGAISAAAWALQSGDAVWTGYRRYEPQEEPEPTESDQEEEKKEKKKRKAVLVEESAEEEEHEEEDEEEEEAEEEPEGVVEEEEESIAPAKKKKQKKAPTPKPPKKKAEKGKGKSQATPKPKEKPRPPRKQAPPTSLQKGHPATAHKTLPQAQLPFKPPRVKATLEWAKAGAEPSAPEALLPPSAATDPFGTVATSSNAPEPLLSQPSGQARSAAEVMDELLRKDAGLPAAAPEPGQAPEKPPKKKKKVHPTGAETSDDEPEVMPWEKPKDPKEPTVIGDDPGPPRSNGSCCCPATTNTPPARVCPPGG